MKHCPNCNEEIEDNFDVCWNCNFSLSENKVVDFKDVETNGGRELNCLRCNVPMLYSGKYKFHEGFNTGLLGNLFELFINKEEFDLYICPKCGKVEFFSPKEQV